MESGHIGDIYTRLTRAEDRLEVHVAELSRRIEQLEQAEQQRASDRQQSERAEIAELRKKVAEAE
jgi:hypothetical protein